jgi:hypothetical protein
MKLSRIIIGVCVLLAACGKKLPSVSVTSPHAVTLSQLHRAVPVTPAAHEAIRHYEAKMADIPLPLSTVPIADYFDTQKPTAMVGYLDRIHTLPDLTDFYIREMERLGWELKDTFEGYERNLYFSRPYGACLVSLRPHHNPAGIVIVVAKASINDQSIGY